MGTAGGTEFALEQDTVRATFRIRLILILLFPFKVLLGVAHRRFLIDDIDPGSKRSHLMGPETRQSSNHTFQSPVGIDARRSCGRREPSSRPCLPK